MSPNSSAPSVSQLRGAVHSVPDLLRICQAAQDAVNRQAEAMRGGSSLRPGPKTSEVYDECTLELTGIEKGSTVLPFRFAKPQQSLLLPDAMTFGADVIKNVVTTVKMVGVLIMDTNLNRVSSTV